jgi:hypothetical protein
VVHACNPAYVGGTSRMIETQAGLEKTWEPTWKIFKAGLVEWLKWQHTCLASVKSQVQTPVPPK